MHIKNPATIGTRDPDIIYVVLPNENRVLVSSPDTEGEPFRDLERDLKVTLNLNEQHLEGARFRAYEKRIKKLLLPNAKTAKLENLQELAGRYSHPTNGQNIEFKDFILWWLDDQIKRRS